MKPENLAEFQQWMQQQLMDPYNYEGEPRAAISEVLQDSERLPAAEHLAIYQRSYIARLRDCMSKQFGALEYALGPELFEGFADAYLSEHPSTSYNLMPLGQQFADYLQATRPDQGDAPAEDWPDFMIELAEFEYAINAIFAEQGDEGYTVATATTPDEQLQLIPVLHLFQHRFPIRTYYTDFVQGHQPELPALQDSHAVVLRHQYRLYLYTLPPAQYHLLAAMKAGATLAQARQQIPGHILSPAAVADLWPVWKERLTAANVFRVKEL